MHIRAFVLPALLALALPLAALEFQPVLNIDGRYSPTKPSVGDYSHGGQGRLVFLPALKLTDKDYLLPLFYADASNTERVISEDIYSFLSERYMFMARPSFKHKFAAWDLKLTGEAKRSVTKEGRGTEWSKGIYDFEDFGGQADVTLAKWFAGLDPLNVGLGAGHRGYINYRNLAPAADGTNWRTKDYFGPKLLLGTGLGLGRARLEADYTLIDKQYDDNRLLRRDGTTELANRVDYYHSLDLGLLIPINAQFGVLADLGAEYNASNQGFFDPAGTLPTFQGYYSYTAYTLRPALRWTPSGKPEGASMTLSYQVLFRNYTLPWAAGDYGRPVQNPDGTYTQGKQADIEYEARLDGKAPLIWGFSLVGGLSSLNVTSNQKYEQNIKTNFEIYKGNIGLQYQL